MHKSADCRSFPFPGQTYCTAIRTLDARLHVIGLSGQCWHEGAAAGWEEWDEGLLESGPRPAAHGVTRSPGAAWVTERVDHKDWDRINRIHDTLVEGARQLDGGPWKESAGELHADYNEMPFWILLYDDTPPMQAHEAFRRLVADRVGADHGRLSASDRHHGRFRRFSAREGRDHVGDVGRAAS
jgi:hypothetical protein